MRGLKKAFSAMLALMLMLLIMVGSPVTAIAAEPPVNLGSTSTFAILAGTGIINTGPSVVSGDAGGDVGSHPTGSFTGQAEMTISGAVHLADAVALQAKNDLVNAYDDAAGRTPSVINTELGGQTLLPGVYTSASGTFEITGTLTLDAQGDPDAVFIFQTSTTLVTGVGSSVNLTNRARYCRVFWKVGSSATLGADSSFRGHLFALQSITANTGATIQGQLLARNGAVTLENNTILNGLCGDVLTIHVMKTATPMEITSWPASITYSYRVTNPGILPLSAVTVVDDKVSPVTYVSGDVNADGILQPGEAWLYTGFSTLTEATTNTVTVTGTSEGTVTSDTATLTVALVGESTPTTLRTIQGGQLPNTATPWYSILLVGAVAIVAGSAGFLTIAREESSD